MPDCPVVVELIDTTFAGTGCVTDDRQMLLLLVAIVCEQDVPHAVEFVVAVPSDDQAAPTTAAS
jgi:hypothetical protein